jgi:hypothetical protein
VLQAVLNRVQGFVAALAAARKQQQTQAASELRQRLAALATAAAAFSDSQQQQQQQGRRRCGSLSSLTWHSDESDQGEPDVLSQGYSATDISDPADHADLSDHADHTDTEVTVTAAAERSAAGGSDDDNDDIPSIELVFVDTPSASQTPSVTAFEFEFGRTAAAAAASSGVPSRTGTSSWFADVASAGGAPESAVPSCVPGSSSLLGYMQSTAYDDGSAAGGAVSVQARSKAHNGDEDAVSLIDEFGMWGDTDSCSQEGSASVLEAAEDSSTAAAAAAAAAAPAAASSSSSSSSDSSSDSSSGRPHPYLSAVIDAPDLAELVGAANMRGLLLQQQQDLLQGLQQQQPLEQQHVWSDIQHMFLATPAGQPLPYSACWYALLLLDLAAFSDAQVLQYWRATVAAAHVAWLSEHGDSSSSSSSNEEQWEHWEGSFLVELLVLHAGFGAAAAMQLVESCSELSASLHYVEATYALACGKEPYEVEYAILKPDLAAAAAAAAADGSSAVVGADGTHWLLIGGEVLPRHGVSHGLHFAFTYKQMMPNDIADSSSSSMDVDGVIEAVAAEAVTAGGAAATHHLAVLLTRAALAQHPWQQAGSLTAMAGAASFSVLQSRLSFQKVQLDMLQQRLQQLVQQMQQPQRCDQQQQQQRFVLHQLLHSAMPAADDAALEHCAQAISAHVEMQLLLLLTVREAFPGIPSSSSSSSSAHGMKWALPAAALHFLYSEGVLDKLQQWQDVISGPLAVHQAACSSFQVFVHLANLGTSSSGSGSSSSSNTGSKAAAAMHMLRQQQPDRFADFAPPGSLQLLLAALETSLCQRYGQLLADSAVLQESAAALAGNAAAGAATCDSLLQQASLAGKQELGQLVTEKGEEVLILIRLSEELTIQRSQQEGEIWDAVVEPLENRCWKFSMVAMLTWHMVDVQWQYEIQSLLDLHQRNAEQLRQKESQLLEQILENGSQITWHEYQVQLRALRQAEVERNNSMLSVIEWQQQQGRELQPLQEAFRCVEPGLRRLIQHLPVGLQAIDQRQQHAKAAASERGEFWREKLQRSSNYSRAFRPSFSSSSSSSSNQGLSVAAFGLPILMSLEHVRTGGLHHESLHHQQQLLRAAVRCVSTAGLGLLHGIGLRLPGASVMPEAARTAAASAAAADEAAAAAAAGGAATADLQADDAADFLDGQQSSSSIAGLKGLFVWQSMKLDVDGLKQLSVLLRCIGGNSDVDRPASSSSVSRGGRRGRGSGHVGNSSSRGAARSSDADDGALAGASAGPSRQGKEMGMGCSILAARGRLAHVLLAADAEAEAGPGSSSSSQVAAQQVLWQLLLAVRPAACAALHCLQPLPSRCVSFGAFARAALDWKFALGGDLGFGIKKQPDNSSSVSSSVKCNHCEEAGYIYVASVSAEKGVAMSNAASAGAHSSSKMRESSSSSSSSVRSVCSSTCCVAEELKELAQHGPPAALMVLQDWSELGHSTADDLKLTGRQDISR